MKTGGIAQDQLKSIIDRIEKLEQEKAEVATCIKDIYAEAKGGGFDTTAIKAVIKLRKMESSAREELEAITDIYLHALGMIGESNGEN